MKFRVIFVLLGNCKREVRGTGTRWRVGGKGEGVHRRVGGMGEGKRGSECTETESRLGKRMGCKREKKGRESEWQGVSKGYVRDE